MNEAVKDPEVSPFMVWSVRAYGLGCLGFALFFVASLAFAFLS